VGCGTGRYALALADRGFHVVAVDQSPGMLRHARVKDPDGRIKFELVDGSLGLPSGPFDAALFVDSWEFFPDPRTVLRNVLAALGDDGRVIIVTPHPAWRVPITLAERLGVKKLAPAYGFGHGTRRAIQAAAAGLFQVRELTWLYATLARGVVLAPSA